MYFGLSDALLLFPRQIRKVLSRVKSIAIISLINGHILFGSIIRKAALNKESEARTNNWLDTLFFELIFSSPKRISTEPVEKSVATANGISFLTMNCLQSTNFPVSIGRSPNLMMEATLGDLNHS
jgi:riboflavin synthase alpha subunit